MFCKDYPGVPIDAALERMLTTEYDLGDFFGGFDLFESPKELLQKLFDCTERFQGMPEKQTNPTMLRVLTMDSGDIALGLNLPSAIFFRAIFGNTGCDWGLQTCVAQQMVSFLFSNVIPYSLFPSNTLYLDSYIRAARVEQLKSMTQRSWRPLTLARNNQRVIPRVLTQTKLNFEGCHRYGLFEDVAHMYTIFSMADEMHYGTYTDVILNKWDFEVWWGNAGDVTPLQRYKTDGTFDSIYSAEQCISAFVKVSIDNSLELHTQHAGNGRQMIVLQSDGKPNRHLAQKVLFAYGWGPSPKWNRTGVVYENLDGELCTLVPMDINGTLSSTVVSTGVGSLKWFNEETMSYVAIGCAGDTYEVLPKDIIIGLLQYGEPLLLQTCSIALQGYVFGPETQNQDWVQVYLVVENAVVPDIGLVSIEIAYSDRKIKVSDTFAVPPCDLRRPKDIEEFASFCYWFADEIDS